MLKKIANCSCAFQAWQGTWKLCTGVKATRAYLWRVSAGVDAAHEVSEDGLDPADLAEAEQLDQLLGVVLRQHRVS